MRNFLQDAREQPEVLKRLHAFYTASGTNLLKLVGEYSKLSYHRIVFAGMGSSYAASRLAAVYLWQHGIPAVFAEASELLHYSGEVFTRDSLVVLISQSGESAEIRQLLEVLPGSATVIGITNDLQSTLARKAAVALPLMAGEESTTSSKTYTSTIAVTLLVCAALAKQDIPAELAAISTAAGHYASMDEMLNTKLDWSLVTEWLRNAQSIYLIGRGPGVSTAIQGALTFKELVKVQAESMEAATFRHGPLETVDERSLIFVFASSGKTDDLLLTFAGELVSCGAKVIVIRGGSAFLADDPAGVATGELSSTLDEFHTALIDIYPVQIAANLLAERLDRNGGFKWITKVTTKE